MDAWQASPDRGELWWRRADGGEPVLCYVPTQPLGAMGAHEVAHAIWYSTVPCDGVTWARCVPPDDAEVTALRARVEVLTAERAEAVAAARREGAEEMRAAANSAALDAVEAAGLDADLPRTEYARVVTFAVHLAIRALPLPGDATPEHATLPAPVCPAPTGAP